MWFPGLVFAYYFDLFIVVDDAGNSVPCSRSFDNSVHARPNVLSVNSSIPEENAVDIADTDYAPVVSPVTPPERPFATDEQPGSEAVQQHPKPDELHEAAAASDSVLSDQQPNRQDVPSSAQSKQTGSGRLRSVFMAVAAVLISTFIGAILLFEFDGLLLPFSASVQALPVMRHKIYHPLSATLGHIFAR